MSLVVVKVDGKHRVQHAPSEQFVDAVGFTSKTKAVSWLNLIAPLADWNLKTIEEVKASKPNIFNDLRELAGIHSG